MFETKWCYPCRLQLSVCLKLCMKNVMSMRQVHKLLKFVYFQKLVRVSRLQFLIARRTSVRSIWKRKAPRYRRRTVKDHSSHYNMLTSEGLCWSTTWQDRAVLAACCSLLSIRSSFPYRYWNVFFTLICC